MLMPFEQRRIFERLLVVFQFLPFNYDADDEVLRNSGCEPAEIILTEANEASEAHSAAEILFILCILSTEEITAAGDCERLKSKCCRRRAVVALWRATKAGRLKVAPRPREFALAMRHPAEVENGKLSATDLHRPTQINAV
jgi:hypothetical protein